MEVMFRLKLKLLLSIKEWNIDTCYHLLFHANIKGQDSKMKNLGRPMYYLQMTWFQYFENPKEYAEN